MEYIFHGNIYPNNTYLHIGIPLHGGIHHEGQEINISLHLYSSNITVICTCSKSIEDILTFRNHLIAFTDNILNIICLLYGVMYTIDFLSYVNTEKQEFIIFEKSYKRPEQEELINKHGENFMNILFCIQQPVGFFVSDCLNNLKLSMSQPIDTGFYIYRCLENIRNAFMDELAIPENKEKDGWSIMGEKLGGDANDINWVRTNYSLPRRHGRVIFISGEDRNKCISIGYRFISSWLGYIIDKYKIDTKTTTPTMLL